MIIFFWVNLDPALAAIFINDRGTATYQKLYPKDLSSLEELKDIFLGHTLFGYII